MPLRRLARRIARRLLLNKKKGVCVPTRRPLATATWDGRQA
jgi:hypothetical protein